MASVIKDYLSSRIEVDSNECWNWKKSLAGNRYGCAWIDGKRISAHRASFQEFIGDIPEGMCVCHKCDNTRCINPSHLFLGTQKDNMRDASRKNRFTHHKGFFLSGENHRMAKLSEKEVVSIIDRLNLGETQISIAKDFGINQSTISDIKRKKHWKHIGDSNEMQMQ